MTRPCLAQRFMVAAQRRREATCLAVVLLFFAGCQRSAAPSDSQKRADLAKNVAQGTASDAGSLAPRGSVSPTGDHPREVPTESGRELYARHCAACHGERGDGKGIAADLVFPRPRNLRAGPFRLVSTDNSLPTREDLHAVLLRGMPGSAMPSWAYLSQQERDALVDEIMRIRREGARESYIQFLKEDEGLTDEEIAADDVQQEIEEEVAETTAPGASSAVPEIDPPTPEGLVRGRDVYERFTCIQCHGETGRGDGVQEMWDDDKTPTRPRDFTLGIFKGNDDAASLYRRIAYGMPGTPMPGSSTMTPQQMTDLVHYIRSLSTDEQRQAAVLKRRTIVAKHVDAVPTSPEGEGWAQAEPVELRLTPLWWRSDATPQLTVQALHDGTNMAVRLNWRDETTNWHALRSEQFEDAVAMELYRGHAEPFLGMGSPTSPVDVWFWDADRQAGPAAAESEYPNTVVDVYPFSEGAVAGAELTRLGARLTDQPDISLPARAVGNLITPRDGDESGGTALHVAGPRTVTFRVPQSQLVRASGTWSDGRWTVVMTRALSPSSKDAGVSLEPGETASVAFAVWDGSHQDRNGQKSFTIWQDLQIEK